MRLAPDGAILKPRFLLLSIALLGCMTWSSAPAAGQGMPLKGKIINGTSQSEGRAETVTLLSLAQGMQEIASLKDVQGSFQFPIDGAQAGPFLLRATYQGVNYFKTIGPFQARQQETHEILVYDQTASLDQAVVRLPHLFIKRVEDQLLFHWSFEVENPTKNTMNKPGGIFRVSIPSDAQSLSVSASGGKMPVKVTLSKDPDGAFRVNYPIKPGKTSIELSYAVDYAKENYTLDTETFYPLQKALALFYPEDLRVESAGLKEMQVDVAGHVKIAGWESIPTGKPWRIAISGGSKIAEPASKESPGQSASSQEAHPVVENPPAVAKAMGLILTLMALGLGLNAAMFLKNKAAAPTPAFHFPESEAYRAKLAQLASARKNGALDEKTFRDSQNALIKEAWKKYLDTDKKR